MPQMLESSSAQVMVQNFQTNKWMNLKFASRGIQSQKEASAPIFCLSASKKEVGLDTV